VCVTSAVKIFVRYKETRVLSSFVHLRRREKTDEKITARVGGGGGGGGGGEEEDAATHRLNAVDQEKLKNTARTRFSLCRSHSPSSVL
jgi:hypothetical protein